MTHDVSVDIAPTSATPEESSSTVCVATNLHHRYGEHIALRGVDLSIKRGEIVALLGPNGSGKTTLFRLLCTLMPVQTGSLRIGGFESGENPLAIRRQIGIVFQSPSLDKKLTVQENIDCQGALYGIAGKALETRRDHLLRRFGLTDRRGDLCESLSGGLQRRVEIAKGVLHQPRLMLLDEPSTGLDPSARLDVFRELKSMAEEGTSVAMTTHLLGEAEKADRVIILDAGEKIAEGSPGVLRSAMGDGVISIVATDHDQASRRLRDELGIEPQRTENELRVQSDSAAELVAPIARALGELAESIAIGRPSLEDVFVAKTGRKFQ